jgi:phasin family protein
LKEAISMAKTLPPAVTETPKQRAPRRTAVKVVAPVPPAPVAAVAAPVEKAAVAAPVVAAPAPVVIEPEIVTATAAKVLPEPVISKPVSEAPVSAVETTIASTSNPIIQQTVKFMATLPTPPFKGYEDLAAFGKANFEAFVQANTILAKGVEELSKEFMTLTQASMETAATTAKAVFAAKTLKDVVSLQADFTKSSFDKFVSNSSKLSELGVKVASDAIAPVTARVNVAVEKVLKPAA